jgi:hypothetical protein
MLQKLESQLLTLSGVEIMGRYKEPVYRPHPLLEELRPRLKASARKCLENSILRVGQLHPVLVTQDNYIIDGRERFDLMVKQGLKPQIRQLYIYSGVDAKALPNAGYSLEDELQSCREVIEETGRGKWQNSQTRRGSDNPTVAATTDHDIESKSTDHDIVAAITIHGTENQFTVHGTENKLTPNSFRGVPCDGKQIAFKVPKQLLEHLELMAIKTNASRGKGPKGKQTTGPTAIQYVRDLCWADFIKHLGDPLPG